jgi:hypothetical protein
MTFTTNVLIFVILLIIIVIIGIHLNNDYSNLTNYYNNNLLLFEFIPIPKTTNNNNNTTTTIPKSTITHHNNNEQITISAPSPTTINIETFQHGYYPHRFYYFQPISCLSTQFIAESKLLGCDPPNRSYIQYKINPITNTNITTCGEIPLIPGACALPNRGKYIYLQNPTITTTITTILPPICTFPTPQSYLEGQWNHTLESYLPPISCTLHDPNPIWLLNQFRGKIIIVMGDSHARNMFISLVSLIRNTRTLSERHPDSNSASKYEPTYRFRVFMDKDDLQFGPVQSFVMNNKMDDEDDNKSNYYYYCIKEKKCVILLFVWASSHQQFIKEFSSPTSLLNTIKPDIILGDFLSAVYTIGESDESWSNVFKSMEDFFIKRFRLEKNNQPLIYASMPFIWGGAPRYTGARPVVRLFDWYRKILSDSVLNQTVLLHYVDHDALLKSAKRDGYPLQQFSSTYHTVCSWYDNFNMDIEQSNKNGATKLTALEPCLALSEKTAGKILLNLITLKKSTINV